MGLRETISSLAYRTPPGKVDVPYIYTYDASALTDGNNYVGTTSIVTSGDSEFILRAVRGMNLVVNPNSTGKFMLYDRGQRQMFQSPIRPGTVPISGSPVSGNWPVMPESLFTPASVIAFDLYGVLRNLTVDTPNIYNSQIAFCGIRRYDADRFRLYRTDYEYRELPFTYTYDLTVNWGRWTNGVDGIPNNVRQFSIPILDTDFELCSIGVTRDDGSLVTTNDFQFALYDASGAQRFSRTPVNLPYINFNAPQQYGSPVFPIPSLVWPRKGLLTFDIGSMLPFGTTRAYKIHFTGIWRQPVNGGRV